MLETTVNSQFQFDKTLLLWLTYKSEANGQIWYVTSDVSRRTYQLWKGKKKTKWESDNPLSLYAHMK